MTETQERFLRNVLTRVAVDSVVELHLFPPIRRGTMETGVAVIATVLPPSSLTAVESEPETSVLSLTGDGDDASPYAADIALPETVVAADDDADIAEAPASRMAAVATSRLRILTAGYRHTIKGVERGKWAVEVQEEADAPLAAVEAVLRGVRQRSSEPADPELVTHDTLVALVVPARVAPAA